MRPPFLRGRDVDLCPPEPADEAALAAAPWRLLPLGGSGAGIPISAVDAAQRLVGLARLEAVDWVRRETALALRWTGDDAEAGEAVRLLVAYAFDELNLAWVDVRVPAADGPMLDALRGLGFLEEGREGGVARLARARQRP